MKKKCLGGRWRAFVFGILERTIVHEYKSTLVKARINTAADETSNEV